MLVDAAPVVLKRPGVRLHGALRVGVAAVHGDQSADDLLGGRRDHFADAFGVDHVQSDAEVSKERPALQQSLHLAPIQRRVDASRRELSVGYPR